MTKILAYVRKHHLALLALFFALGGTSFAASQALVPRNSVGTRQLRNNAVVSSKIKNNQVRGADVRESSLGKVPTAVAADRATNASHASSANRANSATSATNASNAAALGGTPAANFETQTQATARYGRPFAITGVTLGGGPDLKMITVPGLGDLYLRCSATADVHTYYVNTTGVGNQIWVEDDGSHGVTNANGDRAFLSNGQHWDAQGSDPSEGAPVGGAPNSTAQVVTWMISGQTLNRWAVVHVGLSRTGTSCVWMVQGHVVG